ncbi:glycosyltransferase family 2 protein [Aquicoccus porphyridii]|nr:glycosyltransferase [Aquicoccus porphyridii]
MDSRPDTNQADSRITHKPKACDRGLVTSTTAPPHAKFSLITPFLGPPTALREFLRKLIACELHPGEIIVVDNGEEHVLGPVAREFDRVRIIHEPEPGPGPARNAGAAVANFDVIAFLDQDCSPMPGWARAVSDAFQDESVSIVAGQVHSYISDNFSDASVVAYQKVFAHRNDLNIRNGFVGTGNLAVRKHVFDKVGGFSGINRSEERDWSSRATKAGFSLGYSPEMGVHHPMSRSIEQLHFRVRREYALEYLTRVEDYGERISLFREAVNVLWELAGELHDIAQTDRVPSVRERILAAVCCARLAGRKILTIAGVVLSGSASDVISEWRVRTVSRGK